MTPPINRQQACSVALPYWDWEKYYGSQIFSSDIWDGNGVGTPSTSQSNNYYVTDGLFSNWVTAYQTCFDPDIPDGCLDNQNPSLGDSKLKRYLQTPPTLKIAEIMNDLVSRSSSTDFTPWISNNAHNGVHIFVGFSMGRVSTSADDVLFWLHHANVDRFLHLWADCNGYDKLDPSALTSPTHYAGSSGFTLDTPIRFPTPSNFNLDSSNYPTPRQMWTMGTSARTGWHSLYYRYGYDRLASSNMASVCPDQDWTWVNQGTRSGPAKRSNDLGDQNYQETDDRFNSLLTQGHHPRVALEKIAMEDCISTPTDMSPLAIECRQHLSHYNLTRICDYVASPQPQPLPQPVNNNPPPPKPTPHDVALPKPTSPPPKPTPYDVAPPKPTPKA
jgi:hypothetical protein